MKSFFLIPFLFLLVHPVSAKINFAIDENRSLVQPALKDTLIEDMEKEDEIIDEVLKTNEKKNDVVANRQCYLHSCNTFQLFNENVCVCV